MKWVILILAGAFTQVAQASVSTDIDNLKDPSKPVICLVDADRISNSPLAPTVAIETSYLAKGSIGTRTWNKVPLFDDQSEFQAWFFVVEPDQQDSKPLVAAFLVSTPKAGPYSFIAAGQSHSSAPVISRVKLDNPHLEEAAAKHADQFGTSASYLELVKLGEIPTGTISSLTVSCLRKADRP